MVNRSDIRKTEVWIEKLGIWSTVVWDQLEKGDVIRMFEVDGTPILGKNGESKMIINKPVALDVEFLED
jgi:hypothetical protein